jgi:hypothetical protein
LAQAFHADRISTHRAKTAEGYLVALGIPVARTGYQIYKASELQLQDVPPNTPISVYRDAKEVFDPATIASFEGKTITSPHPPQFLTPDNDRTYNLGHAQNVRKGDVLPNGEQALVADLVIKDSRLIGYIETGAMDEISCGYNYSLAPIKDEKSGEVKYAMREIRGNHIAIVPSGRAGSSVRVLDANPEGGSEMEGEKVGALKEFTEFFKSLGLRLTASDSKSETVEAQEEQARKSKELRMRQMDAEEEEKKKEEKEAAEAKKAKDAEEEKEKKDTKDAMDALTKQVSKLTDALEKSLEKKSEDAKCTCDAEKGEEHAKDCAAYKSESEDADLIPVATLPKNDVPENPIPGADAALAKLLAIKPRIAALNDAAAARDFNAAVLALKGKTGKTSDAYSAAERARSSESEAARRQRESGARVQDSAAKISEDYEKTMERYRGKNAADVKPEVVQ